MMLVPCEIIDSLTRAVCDDMSQYFQTTCVKLSFAIINVP